MRKFLRIVLPFALAIALIWTAAAAVTADAQLPGLLSAARTLLFDTSNVTVSGHADFLYNGERFKTADILYKQDGFSSHWQLDLLTPRAFRDDRETGYTVIANNEFFYVMERLKPGVYAMGADVPCDSLLRRTVRSDSLLALASASAGVIESLLPEGAVTVVSDSAEGRELRITLARGDAPDLLNSSLNLAAGYVMQRFMGLDYGRIWTGLYGKVEDYVTVTQGILYTTESFILGDTDVTVRTDAQGRLTGASGSVTAMLYAGEGSFTPLTVTFSVDFSDYGTTVVRTFSPDDFHVVLNNSDTPVATSVSEPDPELAEKMITRAKEILAAAGSSPEAGVQVWEDNDSCQVYFQNDDMTSVVTVSMKADGRFIYLSDGREEYFLEDPYQPTIQDLPENASKIIMNFLTQEAPDLSPVCVKFVPIMEYNCGGVLYEFVVGVDENGQETDVSLTVKLSPSPMIVNASLGI